MLTYRPLSSSKVTTSQLWIARDWTCWACIYCKRPSSTSWTTTGAIWVIQLLSFTGSRPHHIIQNQLLIKQGDCAMHGLLDADRATNQQRAGYSTSFEHDHNPPIGSLSHNRKKASSARSSSKLPPLHRGGWAISSYQVSLSTQWQAGKQFIWKLKRFKIVVCWLVIHEQQPTVPMSLQKWRTNVKHVLSG